MTLLLLLLLLLCPLRPTLSSSSPSSLPPPALLRAWRDAEAEGRELLQRLAAAAVRLRERLSFEEALEHSERQLREAQRRSPLPTAVPRLFEPGDGHVAVEPLPGLPSSAPSPSAGFSEQQLLTADMGVLVFQSRALPLLRLHGLGVVEDFRGAVTSWSDNVTLEQLLSTAPGKR